MRLWLLVLLIPLAGCREAIAYQKMRMAPMDAPPMQQGNGRLVNPSEMAPNPSMGVRQGRGIDPQCIDMVIQKLAADLQSAPQQRPMQPGNSRMPVDRPRMQGGRPF